MQSIEPRPIASLQDPHDVVDDAPAGSAAGTVALMITNRQREQLRLRGFSEEEIHEMTPAEAHAHLDL